MNKIIAELEKKQCKENVTEFNIGDTVKVFTKTVEGSNERIQAFTAFFPALQ